MKYTALLVFVAAVSVAACEDDETTGVEDCTSSATKVCMADDLFDPTTITVESGTTLTWENADPEAHTVTSNPSNPPVCPSFDQTVSVGETSTGITMETDGPATCAYYCKIHATPTTGAMRGTIVVN